MKRQPVYHQFNINDSFFNNIYLYSSNRSITPELLRAFFNDILIWLKNFPIFSSYQYCNFTFKIWFNNRLLIFLCSKTYSLPLGNMKSLFKMFCIQIYFIRFTDTIFEAGFENCCCFYGMLDPFLNLQFEYGH